MGERVKLLILTTLFAIFTITLGAFLVTGFGDCSGQNADIWWDCECTSGSCIYPYPYQYPDDVGECTCPSFDELPCCDICVVYEGAGCEYDYPCCVSSHECVNDHCCPEGFDYVGGQCVGCFDECSPSGTKRCSGNNVQECRADWDADTCLEWGTIQDCSATGEICQNGQCVVDPGTCSCTGCDTGAECMIMDLTDNCNHAAFYSPVCDTSDCKGYLCDGPWADLNCECEYSQCADRACGTTCPDTGVGICNGWGECYADGGCFLECIPPSVTGGNERVCYGNPQGSTTIDCDSQSAVQAACGRTGSIKCGAYLICSGSVDACNVGGYPLGVAGGWGIYYHPTYPDYYYFTAGDAVPIWLSLMTASTNFEILTECEINRPDGTKLWLDNWGVYDAGVLGDTAVLSYTIDADDPEGGWAINYIGTWSDFENNQQGWNLQFDGTDYIFIVDNTPPAVTVIADPSDVVTDWKTSATAKVGCDDSKAGVGSVSGCDRYYIKVYTTPEDLTDPPSECPDNTGDYLEVTQDYEKTITQKSLVCTAAVDRSGNFGKSQPTMFWVEQERPTTDIEPNGKTTSLTSIDFTLDCHDTGGSTCSNTYYDLIDPRYQSCSASEADYTVYTGPVTITGPSDPFNISVCFYSRDVAGNKEFTKESYRFEMGLEAVATDDDGGNVPKVPGTCTESWEECECLQWDPDIPDICIWEECNTYTNEYHDVCTDGSLKEYYPDEDSQYCIYDDTWNCDSSFSECNPDADCPGTSCVYHEYDCSGMSEVTTCGDNVCEPGENIQNCKWDCCDIYCFTTYGEIYDNDDYACISDTDCKCLTEFEGGPACEDCSDYCDGFYNFDDCTFSSTDYDCVWTHNDCLCDEDCDICRDCVYICGTNYNPTDCGNEEGGGLCTWDPFYGCLCTWTGYTGPATKGHCDYTEMNPDSAQNYCTDCGQQWAVGGSGDCTGESCLTSCCGDDDGEVYRTEDTYSNAIAFDDDEYTCCNEGSDCVAGGSCFSSQSAGTTDCGLNLGGNDNCSHCYNHGGNGEWLDCDQADYMDYWCGNTCGPKKGVISPRDDVNYAPNPDWNAVPAGESSVGEYPDTTTLGCCGDDAGEYYVYFKTRDSGGADVQTCDDVTDEYCVNGGRDDTDDACCNYDVANNKYDCVHNGECFSEGTYRDLDGDGVIDGWCMTSDSYQGNWRDCDSDSGACNGGCGHDWVAGGENFQFGEYDTGSETECCGDDAGENYKTRVCTSGCTLSSEDKACCSDPNDCVYNGQCFDEGSRCAPWDSDVNATCSAGSWSQDVNCSTKASLDSGDSGDEPTVYGSCLDFTTCSLGVCPATAYDDECVSPTELTEYNASGASCLSTTYDCSDFEVDATGDTSNDPATTDICTGGTGAGCFDGAFSTTAGSSGVEGCVDPDECFSNGGSGGGDCIFREYYADDSGDACDGLDTCVSTDYNPDTNSNTCENCTSSGRWEVGGMDCDPAQGGVQTVCCCGDDLNENLRTKECDENACQDDSNDDACCNDPTDCVDNSQCFNNGDPLPGVPGATCVDGVWEDTTHPNTTINPDGEMHDGTNLPYDNETSFTLSCIDTGGSSCDITKYRIVDLDQEDPLSVCQVWGDLTEIYTNGAQIPLECGFGHTCRFKVCFASNDSTGNIEPMNISQVFHLETHACQGRECGETCLFTFGICNGSVDHCYDDCQGRGLSPSELLTCHNQDGCFMDCVIPPGSEERHCYDHGTAMADCSNFQAECDRTGAYKCSGDSICQDSLTAGACGSNYGGSPVEITGDWTFYTPPPGPYTTGNAFEINLSGIQGPSGLTLLAECRVAKVNKTGQTVGEIYFDGWVSNTEEVVFSYTIQAAATDPEGPWRVEECDLWSDFYNNHGWELKDYTTSDTFIVDKTPPSVDIDSPSAGWYNNDFVVNATVIDDLSGVEWVRYRWENSTENGTWTDMGEHGVLPNVYNVTLDVNSVSDGRYTIRVNASNNVGLTSDDFVSDVWIDKTPSVFEDYIVRDCDYEEGSNQVCWVRSGTTTHHEIQHSDATSELSRQYITFTMDGCPPDNCLDGDEIKSYVDFDTWGSTDLMTNNSALDIQGGACKGGLCSGQTVRVEWTVETGDEKVNHSVWTVILDAAGNELLTDTGWKIRSDNEAPFTEVDDLNPYSTVTIQLYWEDEDPVDHGGSGIKCYYVQYGFKESADGDFSGWTNIDFPSQIEVENDCTDRDNYNFDVTDVLDVAEASDLNGYEFYFRSLGRDMVGNLESKGPDVNDTNTTIFIPELIEISAHDNMTGKPIRNGAWFPRGKNITISAKVKGGITENLNITINYSNHARNEVPSWSSKVCEETTEDCNVTIGPFESGEVAYYVYAVVSNDPSTDERNPPLGYWYFYIAEHPLCNFLITDVLTTILGSSELIAVEVRNIQDEFDVIGLNFSNDFAEFIETDSRYYEIPLNPGEGVGVSRVIYARLVPSADNFQITLGGNSSIDPTLFDTDTIEIVVGLPAGFPGLNTFAVIILVILATLIYLKFVSTEN